MSNYKDTYEQNGYLVVKDLFSEEECMNLSFEAHGIANGYYCNILNIHVKSEMFFNLSLNPKIVSIADELGGATMIPIGSILFFCKPGNELEKGSNFHQDNYAAKAPYGSYMSCGVAIDQADAQNGSLVVYPGTHKLGELPNLPNKNFETDEAGNISKAYPIGNIVEIPSGYDPVQLDLPRGSVVFIHGHIIHGAPENPSTLRWRRKVYINYIKDGDPFWPGWNGRRQLIDRNSKFQNI